MRIRVTFLNKACSNFHLLLQLYINILCNTNISCWNSATSAIWV